MKTLPYSLIFQTYNALGSVSFQVEAALEPLGLSWAKFNALAQLVDADQPLPFGALADKCACVRSNITQLVERLEADGLVVRNPDPHDRRSVRAELTKKGRTLHAAGIQALHRAERALFSHLSAEQQADFLNALGSLRRHP